MRTFIGACILAVFLLPGLASAQTVPNEQALPATIQEEPNSRVVSAITGQLPGKQRASAGQTPFLIDLPDFIGLNIGNALRELSDGAGNVAVVNQQGNFNEARIDQAGESNVAVMVQRGNFNSSAVTQEGRNNAYGSFLRGNYNSTEVLQRGDNNTYSLNFWGNNLSHTFEQIGSNNTAAQVGVGYRPFGIEQRGSGMNITIRHNQ